MFDCDAPLTADLLLKGAPEIQVAPLTEMLNDIMGPAGLEFQRAETRQVILTAGRLLLELAPHEDPLPQKRFARALESHYDDLIGEDWEAAIRAHKAALTVRVIPSPEAQSKAIIDEDLQDLMFAVAHVTVTYLANAMAPLAVHWGTSGQIFTPPRLMAMADMLFPMPLFVHPVPETSGRTDGEIQVVGFRLLGAETLIGVPLRMAEAPARFDWLLERVFAFIDQARAVGGTIPPGDTFGCAPGEVFSVTEDPVTGGLLLTLKERDGILVLQPEPPKPASEAA